MSVVVSLCLDPTSATHLKDIPPEVAAARKFVLDAIIKAIRDPVRNESLESRYGRLAALADLTYRLLSQTSTSGPTKPQGDAHLHLPKLMLEKNFVSLLTVTLGEINVNFPNVRYLVSVLLKPLELL
jgi:E3 ubiquitin-protein ligase HUWE1